MGVPDTWKHTWVRGLTWMLREGLSSAFGRALVSLHESLADCGVVSLPSQVRWKGLETCETGCRIWLTEDPKGYVRL